jgi:molybdopterin synthase sulfur carrier subunit
VSVKINIHPFFYNATDNQSVAEVEGKTVGQCLEQLVARYPGLKGQLFEKNGKLNRLVEVYVNGQTAYPDELAKEVKDGDEIHLIVFIFGG